MIIKRTTTTYDVIFLIFSCLLIVGFLISLPLSYYQIINQKAIEFNFYNLIQGSLLFINLILLLMMAMLFFSLYALIRNLNVKENFLKKILLAVQLYDKDPFQAFSENAQKDPQGTYRNSFYKYKRYHNLSKKTLRRTFYLIIAQIIVLGFLIFSFTSLNTSNRANLYELQSGQFKLKQINNYQ